MDHFFVAKSIWCSVWLWNSVIYYQVMLCFYFLLFSEVIFILLTFLVIWLCFLQFSFSFFFSLWLQFTSHIQSHSTTFPPLLLWFVPCGCVSSVALLPFALRVAVSETFPRFSPAELAGAPVVSAEVLCLYLAVAIRRKACCFTQLCAIPPLVCWAQIWAA